MSTPATAPSATTTVRAPATKRPRTPADDLRTALLSLAGGQGTITAHAERTWASITFAGTRHTISIKFDGEQAVEAGEAFIAFLPDADLNVPEHLVADAMVAEVDYQLEPASLLVTAEVLLLDESQTRSAAA